MEKIPLLILFFGHVWVDAAQGILPIALIKLKEVFTLSYLQVGLVTSILNFTSSVIQPFFGYVADRYRLGWFIPWGIVWTALTMGLLGWAPNYALILFLVGFAGLGTAAFHPRGMMAVSLLSGTRRGLGTAIFSTGGNPGFAIGPMVGSFLVLGFGLHATVGLVLPGILIALIMILYPVFMSMAILSREVWLWVFVGASGAALLASFSVTIVLAQELLPKYLGLASGLILGLGFGTGGVGVAISGWIADMMGLYKMVWILALVPVLGALTAALIRTPRTEGAQ
jgi:MFS family permease